MSRIDKAIYRLYYTGYDKNYSRKEAMHDLLHVRDSYEKAIDKACKLLESAYWGKEDKKWNALDWKWWLLNDEQTK